MYDRIQHNSTVVVIGAGASGIAASESLMAAGFKVILIEARDRMGGRASTRLVGSVPFDAGASWLADSQVNYLRTTADSMGVKLYPTDFTRTRFSSGSWFYLWWSSIRTSRNMLV